MTVEDAGFKFLAENSIDVICRIGPDTMLFYVSPSAFRVLGWKPEEMQGKVAEDFVLPKDAATLANHLNAGLDESPLTLRMRKRDGTLAWVELTSRPVRDPANAKPTETIIVIRDITERRTLEERLSVLELTDPRTGLATHRAFEETLEREWHRSIRDGSDISLLLLDFDHFRQYHDLHREGDSCLEKAAAAVIGSVRVTDFTALYGIEDIAVILPSTGPGGAAKTAEKIRAAVHALSSSPQPAGPRDGRMAVNVGLASASPRPGGTSRMPELLRIAADNALRKAQRHRIPWPPPAEVSPPTGA
jgi:diguanylate cyclase (GGDEF)-like protein/PAS domain S-box-containing protein